MGIVVRAAVLGFVADLLAGAIFGFAMARYWAAALFYQEGELVTRGRRVIEGMTLVYFQVAFYGLLAAFILLAIGIAYGLARLTRLSGASRAWTVAAALVILALLSYPTLTLLSFQNRCHTDHSFPLPTAGC